MKEEPLCHKCKNHDPIVYRCKKDCHDQDNPVCLILQKLEEEGKQKELVNQSH